MSCIMSDVLLASEPELRDLMQRSISIESAVNLMLDSTAPLSVARISKHRATFGISIAYELGALPLSQAMACQAAVSKLFVLAQRTPRKRPR